MDKKVFGQGMLILAAAYPDYPLKEQTTDLYWEFLRALSNEQFEMAVKEHIRNHKWFPKVSELLQVVRDEGPSPIDVWNRLTEAARDGKKPEMDYAMMKALNFIGGWEAFQYMPTEDLKYRFKDFKEAYLEARKEAKAAQLTGGALRQPQIGEK